jgi:hypothetical protein
MPMSASGTSTSRCRHDIEDRRHAPRWPGRSG